MAGLQGLSVLAPSASMTGSHGLAPARGLGRPQRQRQRRAAAAPRVLGSWGRHEPPPKELAKDPEAKFRR